MATKRTGKAARSATKTPAEQLKGAVQELVTTVGERAVSSVSDKVSSTTKRLSDYADRSGGEGLKAALAGAGKLAEGKSPMRAALSAGMSKIKDKIKGMFGGGGGKGGKLKVTNIVETIDIGAPVELVYAQWTRFTEFPRFMKKVENVEQVSDEKLEWKAQIFLSHRSWESTILEQVPNKRIIWRSKGEKGHVDGAVSFHEIAPGLTRVSLVLEYHPQGLFERTGNIWRAQGRRVRLELKHFRRHVMTDALLHPDDVEGWMGEIRDGEVVDDGRGAQDEADADEREVPDEAIDEDEDEDEYEEAVDEAEDEDEYEEDEDEEEEEAPEAEGEERPARSRRRKAGATRGSSAGTATKTRTRTRSRS